MRLQLAVFDLDSTVWKPEMYQIRGPPQLVSLESALERVAPSSSNTPLRWSPTILGGMVVTDRNGTPITLFDGAAYALSEINRMKREETCVLAAVASRTDEPTWAQKCMEWLIVHDGKTLVSCFDHVEIRQTDKCQHFKKLHRKTGIPYENMCFFDNEEWNIHSVAQLGVKCVHTPDGMTREAWREAIEMFDVT